MYTGVFGSSLSQNSVTCKENVIVSHMRALRKTLGTIGVIPSRSISMFLSSHIRCADWSVQSQLVQSTVTFIIFPCFLRNLVVFVVIGLLSRKGKNESCIK